MSSGVTRIELILVKYLEQGSHLVSDLLQSLLNSLIRSLTDPMSEEWGYCSNSGFWFLTPTQKRLRYPELLFPKVWASGDIRMNSKIVSAKGEHTQG